VLKAAIFGNAIAPFYRIPDQPTTPEQQSLTNHNPTSGSTRTPNSLTPTVGLAPPG